MEFAVGKHVFATGYRGAVRQRPGMPGEFRREGDHRVHRCTTPRGRAPAASAITMMRRRPVLCDVRPANARRHLRAKRGRARSEEHTSELQSLMRISYAVFCLKKKNK